MAVSVDRYGMFKVETTVNRGVQIDVDLGDTSELAAPFRLMYAVVKYQDNVTANVSFYLKPKDSATNLVKILPTAELVTADEVFFFFESADVKFEPGDTLNVQDDTPAGAGDPTFVKILALRG